MLLRSLRVVHFRGIADLHVRQFGETGVQAVRLPAGTDPSMLAEALRFGFLGRTRRATPWISAAQGFVFVEIAFRTAAGGAASVFRGADRHGAMQVSLREDGGGRISSGESEVASRLAELAGSPLDRWEGATFLCAPAASVAPPAPEEAPESAPPRDAGPAEAPPVPTAHPPGDEIASLRRAAVFAVDRLRRSLRAAAVQREAETAFRELATLGARIRRERRTATDAAGKKRTERERFAARVATHEKARVAAAPPGTSPVEPSLLASPVPGPEPRRPPRWLETALGVSALTSLGALLLWASSPAIREQRGIGAALTATFVGSAAVCAAVAWTRRRNLPHEPEAEADEAPAADPSSPSIRAPEEPRRDDADLRTKIHERVAALDAEVAAAERVLEETDAAAAQMDLAIHRAALLLRAAEPAPEEHADGLEAGATAADARTAGADLADRVCRLCVERDALVARDAVSPRVAALAVESEFARLAGLSGHEAEGTAILLRHGARADDVETRPPADAHAFAEALRAEVSRLADAAQRRAPRESPRGPRARELVGAAAGAHGGVEPPSRTTGSEPRFLPEAPAGVAADAAGRELSGLAARLREGETLLPAGEAGPAPRVVVLDRRPGSLATDADLAAFVARESPRATQVVLGVS